MKQGSGTFNKAASIEYNKLESCERDKLSAANDDEAQHMTQKDVKKAGGKIFAKIGKLVQVVTYVAA